MKDEPAFPQKHHGLPKQEIGLTKREYFAAVAMSALTPGIYQREKFAKNCVQMADALIAELSKDKELEK